MSDSTLAPESRPQGRAPLARLIVLTRMLWQVIQRECRLRATIRTLHDLDDRALRDIGLDRADIEEVVRTRSRRQ